LNQVNRILLLFTILSSALASQAQQKPVKPPAQAKPADDSQLYRNSTFGFRYRIPYGWVERTKEMQQQDESTPAETPRSERRGDVLLAVFERPPQATGDTVNSAVVIATESAAAYPGLKSAEDYIGLLLELTTSKGFKPDGDPQELTIGSRSLVRVDFSKALNDKLAMYQSTLVLFEKKQIVSFTFIAGSRDEIDDLVDALSFPAGAARKHP
jgi:hypothetical protein